MRVLVKSSIVILLGEVSIWVLCPFFNWIVCLPGIESYEFFIRSGDGPLMYEKMLKTSSHQRVANENHSEISHHTCQNSYHQ